MTQKEKIAAKILMLELRYRNCQKFDISGRSDGSFDISKVNRWIPENGDLFCIKVLNKVETNILEELKEDLEYQIIKWERINGKNIVKKVIKIANSKDFIMKFDHEKLKELFKKPIL